MGLFDRFRSPQPRPFLGRPNPTEPVEAPLDPGTVTAADGYSYEHDEDTETAYLRLVLTELTVDARKASSDVTVSINDGSKEYVVPAGTPDEIVPGIPILSFTLTVSSDEPNLRLIRGLVPIGQDPGRQPTGTRGF